MKKRLSLLLALIMILALFPVQADSFDDAAQRAGNLLQSYGAIKGDSDGNLMITQTLKRQDAVVILTRLMGKERDAEAMAGQIPSFTDIKIDYYKPFLALAEKNKWVEGKGGGVFGFNDDVTYKEFTAMLLRALGYDTTGSNYSKVPSLAQSLKLYNGVSASDNLPIVRGAAFILMNNTLETPPKGEQTALVFKLGYKDEPKPDGFSVTEAKAAGLKAIDVKFSEAVNEGTLEFITIMDGKKKVEFEPMLLETNVARLLLKKIANQDAVYELTTGAVKSAQTQNQVESYKGKVTMEDTTRPEVVSVEALNPKTLLVKVSEPINMEENSFKTLNEFKIDAKALSAKVHNNLKNELMLELKDALKPGDYKVEISSLRDYANFSTKTAEFDISVKEDKEAPEIQSASMIANTKIKLNFNEPLSNKGQFKVEGKSVSSSNTELSKDKMSAILTISPLGKSALIEVKVEYKDQRDMMGNEVKDFKVFKFKVEDDTTVPEVVSVVLDGTTIKVNFSKPMDTTKGSFTIKKGSTVVLRKTASNGKFDPKDSTTLLIDAKAQLQNAGEETYTLVLEDFVDATVRANELPKTEKTFKSSDKKAPQVKAEYFVENLNNPAKNLKIKLFFSKEMDKTSLLDTKNYTFSSYEYQGQASKPNVRADMVDSTLSFDTEDNNKILVIEATDPKVLTLANITLVGVKDKAGNSLATTTVRPFSSGVQTATGEFLRDKDGFVIKVTFTQPIENMGDDVFKLTAGSEDLNLRYKSKSTDNLSYTFEFDQTGITSGMMKGSHNLNFSLISPTSGDNAKSIYGSPAVAPATIVDKAPPMIALNGSGNPDITYANDDKIIIIEFDEDISTSAGDFTFSMTNSTSGKNVPLKVEHMAGTSLALQRDFPYTEYVAFPNGINTLTLLKAEDARGNEGKNYEDYVFDPLNRIERAGIYLIHAPNNAAADKVRVEFSLPVVITNWDTGKYNVTADGGSRIPLKDVDVHSSGKYLELEFIAPQDFTGVRLVEVEILAGAELKDAANPDAEITGKKGGIPN